MALLFIDGFDHYSTANLYQKWTAGQNTTILNSGGRYVGGGLQIRNDQNLYKDIFPGATCWIVGFGFYTSSFASSGIFRFGDGTNYHLTLAMNTSGQLELYSGSNYNANYKLADSGASTMTAGVWYYVEVKCKIGSSIADGDVIVRVNEAEWIRLAAGTNVKNANSNVITRLYLGDYGDNYFDTTWFDDLYLLDTSGTMNNSFLGDVKIEAIYPNADGSYTQWTPHGATYNWDCVDEKTGQNGDTDYVSASTPGTRDLYHLNTLAATPTSIKGIQTSMFARKDQPGGRVISQVIKSGNNLYYGTQKALPDGYIIFRDVYDQNPASAAAWTVDDIAALECGIEVIS